MNFEMEELMAQKGLWNLPREREKNCRREVPCLKEEGDVIREHSATHEENFLSSWLKERKK